METPDNEFKTEYEKKIEEKVRRKMERHHNHTSNRALAGLVIVGVGAILLAKEAGVYFPDWIFTWPMIVIAAGFYLGAKHSFQPGSWIIVMSVGGLFLLDRLVPELSFHQYLWPIVIIGVGLLMILRSKGGKKNEFLPGWRSRFDATNESTSSDDFLDAVSVFGGNKRNIFSKDFKGGDIVNFFGGLELNLSQADIKGPVSLEITQVFGGARLVVPSNWSIKSELVTVFGSFEDKRVISKDMPENEKVLILRGTCVFGGIDVKSYQTW